MAELSPHVRAAIFDLDGVVTDTAGLHARACQQLFDEVLPELGYGAAPAFDPKEEYRRDVSGRAREDGVRAVLGARGISLPEGTPSDSPEQQTVHGLARRKEDVYVGLLAHGGVQAFPSSVALLRRLRDDGIPIALVTASRNSSAVLSAAGVLDLFDAVVDGDDTEHLAMLGKPDPAVPLEAARRLAVPPAECLVIDDAVVRIQAACRAGFGLVIGVDRTGKGTSLAAAGADRVVADLGGLDLYAVMGGAAGRIEPAPSWRAGAVVASRRLHRGESLGPDLPRVRPRSGGHPRSAVHPGQRLSRRSGGSRGMPGRRGALPRHLPGRRLQPVDDPDRHPDLGGRASGQRAQLAPVALFLRRRPMAVTRFDRTDRISSGTGHAARHPDAIHEIHR